MNETVTAPPRQNNSLLKNDSDTAKAPQRLEQATPIQSLGRIPTKIIRTVWPPRTVFQVAQRSPYLASFIFCVIIPASLISIYFAFIAADQYVSETRFAVRMAQFDFGRETRGKVAAGIPAATTSPVTMPSLAGQEAYVVAAYVRSPAIFADLNETINVREIFSRPEADFWARLRPDATNEELARYWRNKVDAHVNNSSGVVSITVRSFRPEDSYNLAKTIIMLSENLVNRLSDRSRHDMMNRAEQEVRRTEGLVRQVLEETRVYRNSVGFINPVNQAASTTTLLINAMSERIRLQNQYFVASRAMSPEAPSIGTIKSGLEAIDKQIDQLKSQLTGNSEQHAISATIGRFEELELKRQFAERLYSFAQDALERARQKAEWQNIYLAVFVPPALPQMALLPERIGFSGLAFIALLVSWGILALITAAVKDHLI